MMTSPLAEEKIWFNKHVYEEAERQYYESKATLHIKNGILTRPTYFHIPAVEQLPLNMPKENQKTDKKAHKQAQQPTIPVKETVVTAQDALPPSPPLTPKKSTPQPQPAKAKDAKDMKNEADKEGMKKKKKKDKSKKKSVEEVVEKTNGMPPTPIQSSLAAEVAKARWHIKQSLECMDGVAIAATNPSSDILNRLAALEFVNSDLTKVIEGLRSKISTLELRLKNLEDKPATTSTPSAAPSASKPAAKAAPAPKPAKKEDDDDDGVDLFGSDSEEEDEAAKKVREQRLAEYAAKKSKKPVLIAKSNIILDVKPWDDETDMAEMEKIVRSIAMDGLVWGASKLVPLAFGIKKLQISCVVEDDKVSVDLLQETIQEHEDYVQSVDIAAFNKV